MARVNAVRNLPFKTFVMLLAFLAALGSQAARAELQVTANSAFVQVGGTLQLNVLAGDDLIDVAADPSIYYQSSDTDVLSVGATGLVTGVGKGTGSIFVIFGNLLDGEDTLQSGFIDLIVGTGDDTDGDGLPNSYETANGLNPEDPTDAEKDLDGDGLSNLAELEAGTNPLEPDTDLDGAVDGEEVAKGTDPLVRDGFRFDETWQFEINGQTVQAGPGGVFQVSNITAPDDFGEAGQGSARDSMSDAFFRVIGTSNAGGQTRYAYSDPFQIRQGETFAIPELTVSDTPPPIPSRIRITNPSQLLAVGGMSQLSLTATLPDGSNADVTMRSTGTLYLSSNPAIASVTLDGLVTGNAAGRAFITASNEGATAVTSVEVAAAVEMVTVQGYVQLPDGTPVANAMVSTFFGEMTVTDENGFFSFDVSVPAGVSTVAIRVLFEMGEQTFTGGTTVNVQDEGASDAGIISLEPGSSSGREFIVVFQTNENNAGLTPTLFISSESDTFGDIQIPSLGFTQQFVVSAGLVTEVQLPGNAIINASDGIEPQGILITSFDDITVYGLSRKTFTTDAFAAFPVASFGTAYRVLAYAGPFGSSQFAVVAAQDNTTVTITPSVNAASRIAGEPFEITLNNLEAYQLKTFFGDVFDLSGTLITSDKPVGVFAGHSCANVPDGNFSFCDHLVQQIPPLNTWGTEVITLGLQGRTSDTFQILAAEDDTEITITGPESMTMTLGAGQVYRDMLSGANTIMATKPILVAQYANGSSFEGTDGDPFMMIIPPAEQFLNRYTFATPSSGFGRNFVNIVARTEDVTANAVTLDGVPIEASMFTAIGESGFSGAGVPINLGSHTVASSQGLGIYVYGFGTDDSYGYPGGLNLSDLKKLGKGN